MQERQNYQYYNNNSLKDMNQSGQGGSNKQGKKSNYKYANKNNQNNMEDKVNMNSGEHNQNYSHYRPRPNRKNYQDSNPQFKKKNNNKKRRENNNEFQYQNSNASEISQSSKDEYLEQQNNSNIGNNNNNNNNHQNMYNKQYKKNPMLYNNINNNGINNMNNINNNQNINNNNANTNMPNINNPNLTPQRHNQITNPYGIGQNLQNNLNNLNQLGKSPINSMMAQQNQTSQPPSQNQIYINPNVLFMRQNLPRNDNEQEMNMKDEKSSENLSEETLSTRGGNHQSEGSNLQMNKNNNEFINQELLMNNRFLQPQTNYLTMPYNMNNINNINNINNSLGNINNMSNNNYNNINNMQNISNYNQNLVNQINNLNNLSNLGNLNNLSVGNFQMPIYDQQSNQLFNVIQPNLKQNYHLPINDEMNINPHKKIKKIGNKSPNEQNFSLNPTLNLGNVLPNLNYNGPNINNNMNVNSINNKKISLSSQPAKNTIPNFTPGENLNLAFNPNKMPQQGISPLLNMNINNLGKNFYMPQNMKNPHLNNNLWNNANNNNNNHMNGPNNNLNNNNINDNFQGNKNNNLYNKKDFNNRANHNNNQNNNKKYQKLYNHNTYQPSNMNNNHINNKNKLNQNIDINNNTLNTSNNSNNLLQKKNNNNMNNNSNNITTNNVLRNNKPQKKYLLSLCIKLNNNETEIINIKSLKDTNALLQEIKEKRNLNEKTVKVIQKKINNAVEIIKKIFDYNLNKYTYKNLVDINHQVISYKDKGEKDEEKIKKNKIKYHSSKQLNKFFENERNLTLNDVKNVEFLNISY